MVTRLHRLLLKNHLIWLKSYNYTKYWEKNEKYFFEQKRITCYCAYAISDDFHAQLTLQCVFVWKKEMNTYITVVFRRFSSLNRYVIIDQKWANFRLTFYSLKRKEVKIFSSLTFPSSSCFFCAILKFFNAEQIIYFEMKVLIFKQKSFFFTWNLKRFFWKHFVVLFLTSMANFCLWYHFN